MAEAEAEAVADDDVGADTEKLYTSFPHAATIVYDDEDDDDGDDDDKDCKFVSLAAATNTASTHTNELMERSGELSAAAVRFHTLAEAVTTSGENSPAPRRRLRMQN
jgi:hypothetical protein